MAEIFNLLSFFYNLISENIDCLLNDGLGDCSTLCLPTQNGHTCACQTGVSLRTDGKTCYDSESNINERKVFLRICGNKFLISFYKSIGLIELFIF